MRKFFAQLTRHTYHIYSESPSNASGKKVSSTSGSSPTQASSHNTNILPLKSAMLHIGPHTSFELHTKTGITLLAALLPTILLPVLVLIFVRRRRRLRRVEKQAQDSPALAYNPLVTTGWTHSSQDADPLPTNTTLQQRTTQYARSSGGIWARRCDESACGDEGTGVSAARATVVSTATSRDADSPRAAAAEDVRFREKVWMEFGRAHRLAAERRAQRGLGRVAD